MMLNILILNNIRSLLLENPGIFRWADKSELWGIQLMDLYAHLTFLRENGFTRNDRGRVYWVKGDMVDVRSVLYGFAESPNVDSSTVVEPKTNQLREPVSAVYKCVAELKTMVFVGLNTAQLQSKLKGQYDHTTIHRAASKAGATIVFAQRSNIKLYYKFNCEVA